ncbi:CoA-binding protein [Streptomyces amakusaensis]
MRRAGGNAPRGSPVVVCMDADTGTDTGTGAGTDAGTDAETIKRILTATGDTWAVVGLSNNESRAAYGVARVLQRFGKRVVPVHPKAEPVHGEQGYASLADIPFDVDVVDVFVHSGLAGRVADEAVAIGAKAVWFQLGVIDDEAYERTRAAGLDMVMDRCPAIEIGSL